MGVAKEIILPCGRIALVDDQDFNLVSQFKWRSFSPRNVFYAVANIKAPKGKGHGLLMHRLLMGVKGKSIDHINGNGLDNRRENLRLATAKQNAFNIPKRKGCTSRFKGVSWDASKKRWESKLMADRKIFIGRFSDEVEAAKAYDNAAVEHFGSFAKTNEMMGLYGKR